MDWIHFIGKSYYSIKSFEKEAEQYGVSRRIDKRILKKMNYGDKVYLFQKDGKSSLCFGYFTIDSVWGQFKDSMMKELEDEGSVVQKDCSPPMIVSRGCGQFVMTGSTSISCSLQDLAEKIEQHGGEQVMVGGTFVSLDHIRSAIPHQQGFRKFASDEFMDEWKLIRNTKRSVVKGHFYVDNPKHFNEGKFDGAKYINTIADYHRKGTAS